MRHSSSSRRRHECEAPRPQLAILGSQQAGGRLHELPQLGSSCHTASDLWPTGLRRYKGLDDSCTTSPPPTFHSASKDGLRKGSVASDAPSSTDTNASNSCSAASAKQSVKAFNRSCPHLSVSFLQLKKSTLNRPHPQPATPPQPRPLHPPRPLLLGPWLRSSLVKPFSSCSAHCRPCPPPPCNLSPAWPAEQPAERRKPSPQASEFGLPCLPFFPPNTCAPAY